MLEILKLISRRACKFKASSSESLAVHLLAHFYIRHFYTAHCYLVLQRELMWQGSILINAQTPACCAAWLEPFFRIWSVELQVSFFVLHQPSQTPPPRVASFYSVSLPIVTFVTFCHYYGYIFIVIKNFKSFCYCAVYRL